MFPLDGECVYLSVLTQNTGDQLRTLRILWSSRYNPGNSLVGGVNTLWWRNHGKWQLYMRLYSTHEYKYFLDSGATTSILSFDLARRLKLSLNHKDKLRILGYGDVPTYISAKARIKLTMGPRVVYVLDVWVGNIEAGVDCLLGMDFMMSAGVRLCVHEGVVKLPDEESLLLVGGPEFDHLGMDLSHGYALERLVVPIQYGRANPEFLEFWAGHGETWVTRFICGVHRRPKAVEIVNVSNSIATAYRDTVVAHVMEKGYLPRPSYRKYGEWRTLIYELEPSLVLPEDEEEEKLWKEIESVPSVNDLPIPVLRRCL
ncbi:hypothetical protein PHMEG_00012754 [Phytophthora megakarya]|uniref:Peptidase A2 domain-containing protein n=1 Tax=Phytophthora megakarya TaxID=4795 RepID=A0A225W8X8_9STRA|nr:hypothetical protein PHMEG_00012754 [Phytophthora megakarya]